jgi:hypothetical protein
MASQRAQRITEDTPAAPRAILEPHNNEIYAA